MKIQAINTCSYNTFPLGNNKKTEFFYNNSPSADVISFSSKKYDYGDITNPTNHCGYCGCKVYTEAQLDSIAKEMLSSKSERLQGKIKSVLEKLEGAKHSEEIALAKRIENREEVEFFRNFLDASSKKSYLKGNAIFEQTYHKNADEAIKILTINLKPLLRTVDHISPQNREEENNHSDINLIESCYCCNHDLKKGISFNEFYAMFPSIKNNLPSEKFKYASSNILEGGQSGIIHRLSAANMIKSLQRLFMQRDEAERNLKTIDFRISEMGTQIDEKINLIKTEIKVKKEEISELELKLNELNNDEEFRILQKRNELKILYKNEKKALDLLIERKNDLSYSVNQLANSDKPTKKNKNISKFEAEIEKQTKESKIAELKHLLSQSLENIKKQEDKVLNIKLQIENLNKQFPPIEMLQTEKQKIESFISAYSALNKELIALQGNETKKKEVENQINDLNNQLKKIVNVHKKFDIGTYSKDDKDVFNRYQAVSTALNFIAQHPNGDETNVILRQAAKKPLEDELFVLKTKPVVIDYLNSENKKLLTEKLKKLEKDLDIIINKINSSEKQIKILKNKTFGMNYDEANLRLEQIISLISRLAVKQDEVKIPNKINTLETEIAILEDTIQELKKQKNCPRKFRDKPNEMRCERNF